MLRIVSPSPFAYSRPTEVEAALDQLAEEGAVALAGGTDLVTMRASGAVRPSLLVDLKGVSDLYGVEIGPDGGAAVGPTTTFTDLAARSERSLAAVLDGARLVGAVQTRNRATLGGNLCRASPAGDTLCGLLVLDAVLEARSVNGTRSVAVRDFFAGPGRSVLADDELLVRIRIPDRAGSSAYRRFTYRSAMDLAVVGVAVWLRLEDGVCADAEVAVGAVAPTPRLVPGARELLIGSPVDDRALNDLADLVVDAAEPIDDVRGTRRHRLRVLRALVCDVAALALERQGAEV